MSARLIVGLGNPGREYEKTRHNVGFMGVSALAEHWGMKFTRRRARSEVAEGTARGDRVVIAKPQTYMNNSGEAARGLLKMYNLEPAHLLVVSDDMDLPFGRLRLRERGSSGGHNGMQSIVDHLHTTEFFRLRVGVGRPPSGVDPIDYLLSPFTASELAAIPEICSRIVEGIDLLVAHGGARAMDRINLQPRPTNPATAGEPPPNR